MTNCPCCESVTTVLFNKKGYDYHQCSNCKTLFVPEGIDQSNMVGGGYEVERNITQNEERINRFIRLVGVCGRILDYGCGHGMLVGDCKKYGLNCDGYDKFNLDFNKFGLERYNLVSMVEVIEHTFSPFNELNEIYHKLLPGGVLYIETSFIDIAEEEKISLEDFFYIEPSVGHCTIFSHYGLDLLMTSKGFKPLIPINRNVRLYQKQ